MTAIDGRGARIRGIELDGNGHFPCGRLVAGKRELASLLRWWLEQSGALTIGDPESYGRRPCLRIDVAGHQVVLHADTKRAAVAEYVRASGADPDLPWLIVATARGGCAARCCQVRKTSRHLAGMPTSLVRCGPGM